VQNVTPELFALRLGPAVIPLENGDHELGRAVDDFRERSVNRFRGRLAAVRLRERPLVITERSSCACVQAKLGANGGATESSIVSPEPLDLAVSAFGVQHHQAT
jgi:hypothetical protein